LQWTRELATPDPAYPTDIRLRYDATYEPVVLGKTMFIPSMVTDTVTALDTNTGEERWRFFSEGPVRFAPVAWKSNVYFVSDDGYLYCVNMKNGKLKWKFRGYPEGKTTRRVMGNGRLIPLFPARGGPALVDGVVYFGAGIWSGEGVFVHALDAETGKAVWSNIDSDHIEKANMDHGVANVAGISPQGYLAVLGKKLVVPCGAQLPAVLDLDTGKIGPYTMGWGGRVGLAKGSWFVAGTGKYLVHGGDLYDIEKPSEELFKQPRGKNDFKRMLYFGGLQRLQTDRSNQKELSSFRKPVFTQDTMYTADDGLAAYSLTEITVIKSTVTNTPAHRKNDQYPDRSRTTFRRKWGGASQGKLHIKAGDRLYCSQGSTVQAVGIPNDGEKAEGQWKTEIEGTPHTMLAADDKLFVVTREGRIHAFGKKKVEKPAVHRSLPPSPPTPDKWTKEAARTLKAAGMKDGYALVLGLDNGRLAEELVRQSDCQVIAVDDNETKVTELRQKFHKAGLYGTRISIYLGDPVAYPFPPLLASLITTETPEVWDAAMEKSSSFVLKLYGCLRPHGGSVRVDFSPRMKTYVSATTASTTSHAYESRSVKEKDGIVLLSHPGPLPGADNWSHQGANAANTGASQDTFLDGALGRLWFDSRYRWSRHVQTACVRIADGRMLIRTDKLRAIDVYTGRLLWETDLGTEWSRGEVAVVEDAVYVTGRKVCVILDPVTGEKKGEVALPEGLKGPLSRIRVKGDHIVGSADKVLFCINRRDGKIVWAHERDRSADTIALGGGKVFCSDHFKKVRGKPAPTNIVTEAFALDTGKQLWKVVGGSEIRYSEKHDLLVMAKGVYKGEDGTLVWKGGGIAPIAGDNILSGTAEQVVLRNLMTGESGSEIKWQRRGCTALRASSKLMTTRYRGNSAYIDIESGKITSIWNVRAACSNNIFPANGVLSIPNLSGGCTCNYMPVSQAFVPVALLGVADSGSYQQR
jgi:outer membrane protein assembly factor BamB